MMLGENCSYEPKEEEWATWTEEGGWDLPPIRKVPRDKAEELLEQIFGSPIDGTLILRVGGWTISPFSNFAITPPVTPRIE